MAVFTDLLSHWELVFSIVPALILFLYGIEHFSVEIQNVAGQRFRDALARLTSNRVKGFLLGGIVTGIVQSSSATTVIIVGLVNAGTISFAQSIPVILGANVGTTITAQLVALKLTSFAPVFILLGFFLGIVGGRYRFLGKPVFYFGLVFFSLNLISDAISPIKSDPSITSLFASFSSVPLAVFAGFLFTVIVQSSSVTSGIVVLLADSGLIGLEQGVPLLLGAAIGTTTTALIASSRMSLHAKRAATAHLAFNLASVILILPFITPFAALVSTIGGTNAQQIANAHTIFRLIFAVIFLIILSPFRRLVEKVVSGLEEEILFKTRYLTDTLPEKSVDVFSTIEHELHHLLQVTRKLFDESFLLLSGDKKASIQTAHKLEALNDYIDERIEGALLEFSRRNLSKKDARRTILLVRLSNSIEQLGDAGEDIAALAINANESNMALSEGTRAGIMEVYDKFYENLKIIDAKFTKLAIKDVEEVRKNDKSLAQSVYRQYEQHIQRLQKAGDDSMFVEIVSLIETANGKVREMRKICEEYD